MRDDDDDMPDTREEDECMKSFGSFKVINLCLTTSYIFYNFPVIVLSCIELILL